MWTANGYKITLPIADRTSENRVSDLIAAYEKIVEGNYIDNIIRPQREQELAKNGEKRT